MGTAMGRMLCRLGRHRPTGPEKWQPMVWYRNCHCGRMALILRPGGPDG